MTPDWTLIEIAGRALGVGDHNLNIWRRRGVPGKWHLPLLRYARENDLRLIEADMMWRPDNDEQDVA